MLRDLCTPSGKKREDDRYRKARFAHDRPRSSHPQARYDRRRARAYAGVGARGGQNDPATARRAGPKVVSHRALAARRVRPSRLPQAPSAPPSLLSMTFGSVFPTARSSPPPHKRRSKGARTSGLSEPSLHAGRSVSSVRNRWQRIEKGRKLREAGHASKNRCQRCGAPKRGHVCLAKLDQRASADAVAAAGLGQGGGLGVATSAPSLPRPTQASGREAAASGASAAVGGVSAAAGGVSAVVVPFGGSPSRAPDHSEARPLFGRVGSEGRICSELGFEARLHEIARDCTILHWSQPRLVECFRRSPPPR